MFRRTIIWLLLTALFMGTGGYLTVLICTVEGRLPFELLYRSYFKPDSKDLPDGEYHGMFISILQPGADILDDSYALGENLDKFSELYDWDKDRYQSFAKKYNISRKTYVEAVKKSGFSDDVIEKLISNEPISVQYRQDKYAAVEGDKSQGAGIAIQVPANRPIRVLLSGVSASSAMPCRSVGVAPSDNVKVKYQNADDGKGKYVYFKPKTLIKLGIKFSLMTFTPQDSSYVIWCDISPDVSYESFTKREMEFSYFVPGGNITSDGRRDIADQKFVDDDGIAKDYKPVSKIKIKTSVKGSDNLHFTDGHPVSDMANFNIERVLTPDSTALMEWDDIVQNQYRDIILVIIGTLLAFGVTFFIEALRPLIDGGKE